MRVLYLMVVVVPVLALLLSQPVRVQGATVARSMVSAPAPHLASNTAAVSSSLVAVAVLSRIVTLISTLDIVTLSTLDIVTLSTLDIVTHHRYLSVSDTGLSCSQLGSVYL